MTKSVGCLLDSNILLRAGKIEGVHFPEVEQALESLSTAKVPLYYTSQMLGEFWNVCTRPLDKNGFGLSVQKADLLARSLEGDYILLAEIPAVHDRWRSLLVEHKVKGVQVHDARIAASMYVNGVSDLLTLNPRDFVRFPGIRVLRPGEIGEAAIR